jgi:hypothetical protein
MKEDLISEPLGAFVKHNLSLVMPVSFYDVIG